MLLPGLDGTGRLFQPLLEALPVGTPVVVHRYPLDPALGYDALTEGAWAALPESGPVILLGESFSGPVAIRLAARLGARTRALVLCCTFATNPHPGLSWLRPSLACLPAPSQLPQAWVHRALLGRSASPAVRAMLSEALAELPAPVVRARLGMVLQVDVRPALASVRAPILCLQAHGDRLVPGTALRRLAAVALRADLVTLAGPHGLLQVAPRPALAAITAFLAHTRGPETVGADDPPHASQ